MYPMDVRPDNLENVVNALRFDPNYIGGAIAVPFKQILLSLLDDVINCDFDAFKHFFHSLLQNFIYVAPSQYEVGFISLSHSQDILNTTISKIELALKDIFVHASAVKSAGLRRLQEGQKISFDVEDSPKGPNAINIKTITESDQS